MTAVPLDAPLELTRSWWSYDGPHGGYVASLLLQAAARRVDRPARSLHVQFLGTAAEGPAEVDATVVRQGRTASFVSAAMTSAGSTVARGGATFGPARSGPAIAGPPPPPVEPPEDLDALELPPEMVPFTQHLEYRPAAGARIGGGTADIYGWVRFRDDRPVDDSAAAVLVDALPPGLYGSLPVPVPVPTVDLSVQFTALQPFRGWVMTRITTRHAADGWCVDDSEIWTPDRRLVASARQTRLVMGAAA